jgi:hypothetical protein
MLGSGTEAGTWMLGCFEVVERIPLRRCFMWPFEVAMLGGRYLATFSPEMGSTVEESSTDGFKERRFGWVA